MLRFALCQWRNECLSAMMIYLSKLIHLRDGWEKMYYYYYFFSFKMWKWNKIWLSDTFRGTYTPECKHIESFCLLFKYVWIVSIILWITINRALWTGAGVRFSASRTEHLPAHTCTQADAVPDTHCTAKVEMDVSTSIRAVAHVTFLIFN